MKVNELERSAEPVRDLYRNIIVTLYEGHYHYGVAALLNSLKISGFVGLFRVGFKGNLPPWTGQLKHIEGNLYELDSDILVSLENLNPEYHFGYYKPYFIKDSFDKYPTAENVSYFDPDIVVIAPWEFYLNWTKAGVALCTDNCFPFVHRNHPWRKEWRSFAPDAFTGHHIIDQYVNSGFVGVKRSSVLLIERWIEFTEKYNKDGGNLSLFEKDAHRAFKGDQDLLNAAITVTPEIDLSIIGSEGMGFSFPAYLMAHAVGNVKPWKENFIRKVLFKGIRPSFMSKCYFKYCNSPIVCYNGFVLFYYRLCLKLAAFLGRLLS